MTEAQHARRVDEARHECEQQQRREKTDLAGVRRCIHLAVPWSCYVLRGAEAYDDRFDLNAASAPLQATT